MFMKESEGEEESHDGRTTAVAADKEHRGCES